MRIRFLPQQIHGMLDYTVALTLVVVPFLYSLATDYRVGVVSAITIRQHLALDAIAGALFAVLSVAAGFSAEASVFYGVIGLAVLAEIAR